MPNGYYKGTLKNERIELYTNAMMIRSAGVIMVHIILVMLLTVGPAAGGSKVFFPDDVHYSSVKTAAVPLYRPRPIFKPPPIPEFHSSGTHHEHVLHDHDLGPAYPKNSLVHQALDHSDYNDDGEPGLFAPAINKPFERARTLTGRYYMPELAYQRNQPIYDKRVNIHSSKLLRPKPISISGAVLPVGVPVSLGSPSYLAKSYGGYGY